jgi:hypothetical protein
VIGTVAAGLALAPTGAWAKRPPGEPPERRGCSERDWQVVVERDEFRLCLLARN